MVVRLWNRLPRLLDFKNHLDNALRPRVFFFEQACVELGVRLDDCYESLQTLLGFLPCALGRGR